MVTGIAIGSSLTPFVPVPFVDGWIYGRLLRRIARKVMDKSLRGASDQLAADIVVAFRKAGDSTLAVKAVTTVARFAIRKLAMVLDVKASHDVFGESIAFALALHAATQTGRVSPTNGEAVGVAIYKALELVGSAPLAGLTRAAKEAFAGGKPHERIAEAIGKHVDEVYAQVDRAVQSELR